MDPPGLSDPDIGDLGSLDSIPLPVSIDPPPARSTSPPLPPRKNTLGLPPTYLAHLRALLHQWLEQQTREENLSITTNQDRHVRLWEDQRLAQIEEAIWTGAVIPGDITESRKRLLQLDWQLWAPGSAKRKRIWRERCAKLKGQIKNKGDKSDKGETTKGKKRSQSIHQDDSTRGRLFAPSPMQSASLTTTPSRTSTRPASVTSADQKFRRDESRSPMNASPTRGGIEAEDPEEKQRQFNRLVMNLKGYEKLSMASKDEWELLSDDLHLPVLNDRELPGAFPQSAHLREPSLPFQPPAPPPKMTSFGPALADDDLVKPLFCVHFPAPSTSTVHLRRQSSFGHQSRDSIGSANGRWWTGSNSGRRWSGVGPSFGQDDEQDVEVEFIEGKFVVPMTTSTPLLPKSGRKPSLRRKGTTDSTGTATATGTSLDLSDDNDAASSTWSGTQRGASGMNLKRDLSLIVSGSEDDIPREEAELGRVCLVGGTVLIRGIHRDEEREAIQSILRVLLYSVQSMIMELELLDAFRVPREADPRPISPKPLYSPRQNSSPNTSRPASPMLRRTVTVRERGERTRGFFQRLGKDTRGMLDTLMGKSSSTESTSKTLTRDETMTLSTATPHARQNPFPATASSTNIGSSTPSIPQAADRHLRTLANLEALLPSVTPSVRLPMPPLLLRVREEERMRSEKAKQEIAEETAGTTTGTSDGLTRHNSTSHRIRARAYRMGGDVKAGLCALMSGMDEFDGWIRLQRLEVLSCTGIEIPVEEEGGVMMRTTICERPKAMTYNFWHNDDETIQDVINGIMTDEEHVCSRGGCDASQEEHTRWWLQDGKKLGMLIRKVELGMGEIGLDCWVKCAECKKASEPKKLGDIASSFSWGKLLELIFYTSILCPSRFCPHSSLQPSPIMTHIRSPHIVITLFVGNVVVHDTRLPKLQVGPNVAKRKAGSFGAVGTVDGLMKKEAQVLAMASVRADINQVTADLRRRVEVIKAHCDHLPTLDNAETKNEVGESDSSDKKPAIDDIELELRRTETDLDIALTECFSGQLNDVRQRLLTKHRMFKGRLDELRKELEIKEGDQNEGTELPCYFGSKIHAPPGSSFLIREDEPSSVISYALSSIAYFCELTSNGKAPLEDIVRPEKPEADAHGWTTEVQRKDTPRDLLSLRTITKKRSDANVMKNEHRSLLSVAPNQPSLEVSLEQVEGKSQASDTMEDLVRSISKATAQDPVLTIKARTPSISDSESILSTPRLPSTMTRRTSDSVRTPPSAFRSARSVSGAGLATSLKAPAAGSSIISATTPRPTTPVQEHTKDGWSSVTTTFTNSFHSLMRMGTEVGTMRMRGGDRPLSALMGPLGMMTSMDNSLSSTNQDDRPHIQFTYTLPDRLRIFFTIYYATSFDSLRRRCAIDRSIIESLSRCEVWDAQGGKSKASFFMTQDRRYIVKELVTKWNVSDLQALLEIAPSYFEHLANTQNKAVALAKIVGFYTIKIHDLQTSTKKTMDLMVMENLFYKQSISQTYDLKGIEGRKVPKAMADGSTLFDSEWIEGQMKAPILLHPHAKRILQEAIYNDTKFLCSQSIMDYSLLLGLDTGRREIVVGLVDAIGSYNLFKTIESRSKLALTRGGEVTIIPPDQYRDRFENALKNYFIACPDKWSKPARRQGLDDSLPSVM